MGTHANGQPAHDEPRAWRWRTYAALVSLCVALALTACAGPGSGSSSAGGGDFSALEQRPLQLPSLTATGDCPVSAAHSVLANEVVGKPASSIPVVGTGPAYVTGTALIVIGFIPSGGGGGGGHGGKPTPPPNNRPVRQVWLISSSYHGPLLVRGGRLDGTGHVTFGGSAPGATSTSELRMTGGDGSHWTLWQATITPDSAGCFAFQVDGDGFSYSIVQRMVYTRD